MSKAHTQASRGMITMCNDFFLLHFLIHHILCNFNSLFFFLHAPITPLHNHVFPKTFIFDSPPTTISFLLSHWDLIINPHICTNFKLYNWPKQQIINSHHFFHTYTPSFCLAITFSQHTSSPPMIKPINNTIKH